VKGTITEDWRKLYFIMIQGKASIIGGKELEQNEQILLEKAHKLLSGKYVQKSVLENML
jgi:hypothetical protein